MTASLATSAQFKDTSVSPAVAVSDTGLSGRAAAVTVESVAAAVATAFLARTPNVYSVPAVKLENV